MTSSPSGASPDLQFVPTGSSNSSFFQASRGGTEGAIAMDERRASQQTAAVDKDGIEET
jgi:hypothetical protein